MNIKVQRKCALGASNAKNKFILWAISDNLIGAIYPNHPFISAQALILETETSVVEQKNEDICNGHKTRPERMVISRKPAWSWYSVRLNSSGTHLNKQCGVMPGLIIGMTKVTSISRHLSVQWPTAEVSLHELGAFEGWRDRKSVV